MKKQKILISVVFIIIFFVALYYIAKLNEANYSISIVSYTENTSYIEHPVIEGLIDKKKQDSINTLLKDQVLFGAKNNLNETFVDFSYPNYSYQFRSGVGISNRLISSFWYSFDGFGEVQLEDGGVVRNTYRHFGITIDMETGKKIHLSDFMEIDERLINSSDGSGIETDYNIEGNPVFHNFKDAFMIYTSEDKRDNFHLFSSQEIIEMLKDNESETKWYIDENRNIIFIFGESSVSIPYLQITDAIYPKYRDALKK